MILSKLYKFQEKCHNLMSKHGFKILAISGLLSNLSSPPVSFLPILIICFIPLSLWLKTKDNKRLMKGVIIFIFARMVGGIYWIGIAPGTLLGPYGYVLGFFFCLIAFSVLFAQLYISYLPIVLFKNFVSRHIAFIFLWSFSNWCFEYLFIPELPWQNPAMDISSINTLANSSAVFGIHSLGLAASAFTISIVYALTSKSHIKPLLAAVTIFMVVLGSGIWNLQQEKPASNNINVTVLQPNLPLNSNDSSMTYKDQVYRLLALSQTYDNPDLIVWPETSIPYAGKSELLYKQIQSYLGNKSLLIFGQAEVEASNNKNNIYNSLFMIDKQGELIGEYRKNHLVPFGEYTPFREQITQLEEAYPSITSVTQLFPNYSFGDPPKTFRLDSFPNIAPAICFEIVFATGFIEEVSDPSQRAQLIVNITEDGWFGYSFTPYYHLANVKMRAIEQGLPVVRSANSGVSAVYDAFGREIGYLGLYEKGAFNVNVPLNSRGLTPFTKWHNIPYAGFMFLTFLVAVIYRRKKD